MKLHPRLNRKYLIPIGTAFFALASAVALMGQAGSTASTATASVTNGSIVRGKVLELGTEKPVRRARVTLYDLAEPNKMGYRATANTRGEFVISNVRPGRFLVLAYGPGMISAGANLRDSAGDSAAAEPGLTTITVDGKSASEAVVHLLRGGVIAGRVRYADGEPVVNSRLVLYRRKGENLVPYVSDRAFTNDQGGYRISGLLAGEYAVGIAEDRFLGGVLIPDDDDPRPQLPAAFYPNATALKQAQIIRVTTGAEVKGIDITIAQNNLFAVSGTVRWKGIKRPLSGVKIAVTSRDEGPKRFSLANSMFMLQSTAGDQGSLMLNLAYAGAMSDDEVRFATGPDGSWRLGEMVPGEYQLEFAAILEETSLFSRRSTDDETGANYSLFPATVTKTVSVTVSDHDVSGVAVELSPGSVISGTVASENTAVGRMPAQLAVVNAETGEAVGFPSISQRNGSFRLAGIPAGKMWLDLSAPRGFYVRSAKLGSSDLMREPLTVIEGVDISDVQIELASDVAHLSGKVTATEGTAGGARLMAVPADPARWNFPSAAKFAQSDLNGAFKLELPPGDYLVFTWALTAEPSGSIRNFVQRHAPEARRVSVGSNDQRAIELPILVRVP